MRIETAFVRRWRGVVWLALAVATLIALAALPGLAQVVPDEYEPDNAWSEYSDITPNGGWQDRTIAPAGDEDWVFLYGTGGNLYHIRARAHNDETMDTYLELYRYDFDESTLALVKWNDDSEGTLDSRIDEFCGEEWAYYFVRARHYEAQMEGSYQLAIWEIDPQHGLLGGRVTDADGDPLEGVVVRAFDPWDMASPVGVAETDDQGTYWMLVEPGWYVIQFDPTEYNLVNGTDLLEEWYAHKRTAWDANWVWVEGGSYNEHLDATLEEAGHIRGTVVNYDDVPVESVDVCAYEVRPWGGWVMTDAWTDADGRYDLRVFPATWKVYFDPSGYNDDHNGDLIGVWYDNKATYRAANALALAEGDVLDGIDAKLQKGTRIEGRVTDRGGNGLPDIIVEATGLYAEFPRLGTAYTDSDGYYHIRGLRPGTYKVRFEPWLLNGYSGTGYLAEWYDDTREFADAAPISVAVGNPAQHVDASLDECCREIRGVVRDQSGNGLVGVWVRAYGTWDDEHWLALAVTDSDGSYTLRGYFWPWEKYRIEFDASSLGYTPQWYDGKNCFDAADLIAAPIGEALDGVDATIPLAADRRIQGLVVDAEGNPLEGVLVSVYERRAYGEQPLRTAYTDAEGAYTFDSLWPGGYYLHFDPSAYNFEHGTYLSYEWYQDAYEPWAAAFLPVPAGEDVDAGVTTLSALNGLTVNVRGYGGTPLEGVVVDVYRSGGMYWGEFCTDADGNVYAADMPDGEYYVWVDPDEYNTMNGTMYLPEWFDNAHRPDGARTIALSGGETTAVTVQLDVGGVVEGRVRDAATHEPLGDVDVYGFDSSSGYQEFQWLGSTDWEIGFYRSPAVIPDSYRVVFDTWWLNRKAGTAYVPEWYDNALSKDTATDVEVTAGEVARDVDADLEQGGVLEGFVTDPYGLPLRDVKVVLEQGGAATDFLTWTDDDGYFAFRGVPEGPYQVFADPRPLSGFLSAEWYEDSYARAEATDVFVVAGETTSCAIRLDEDGYDPVVSIDGIPAGGRANAPVTPTVGFSDNFGLDTTAATLRKDGELVEWWQPGMEVTEEGEYVVEAWATDLAGNEGYSLVAFTIDLTAPAVSITGVENGAVYNTTVTPVILFAGEDIEETSLTLNGSPWEPAPIGAPGLYTILVKVRDGSGNEASATATFRIDRAAPTAAVTVPTYASSAGASTSFIVRWSGADPAPASGVASFDVEYRVGATGIWRRWFTATTLTSKTFTGSQGATYYFRVRARDRAGNTGAWSTVRYCVVPYDQAKMTFSTGWGTYRASSLYLGSSRYASTRSRAASFRFSGAREITLIATRKPSGGYAYVYINNRLVKTVSLYASRTQVRVPIVIKTYASPTSGTLRVVVSGRKPSASRGYLVEIDGLAIRR